MRKLPSHPNALRSIVLSLGLGFLATSPASGALSLGGQMALSPDDISGFTTLSGNDTTANATLPFSVAIDGTSYNTVTISTNGWIEFGGNTSVNSDPTNDCLPTSAHTNPFLAAYWDDMRTINTHIRYGTVGGAPGRVFVVDVDFENDNTNNHDMTMQVQIHEGSNLITVKYLASENEANGQTATIGFQGAGGGSATAHSITCNGKVLDDNTTNEGWSVVPGTATAPATLHAIMASSRDDLPGGFTTLTGDDVVATPTMPFSVSIDGTSYNTVAISTNGWLEFGGNTGTGGTSSPTNACLPTSTHTNPFLAAYWDNLQTITGTATNHIRYGTVGTTPGRTFIVDFRVENAFGSNHNVDMQVQVHEQSNLIVVKYHGNEPESVGQTATIGFQNAGGGSARAQSLTCNGRILDDDVANEGWSLDLTTPRGGALGGIMAHSRNDIGGFTSLSGDSGTATASLGFTVNVEGTTYSQVILSTNGWIEFGSNTSGLASDPTNACLPTSKHTNAFLAAFWDDMRTLGSAIRYGTVGSAGGRTFVADFELERVAGANHNNTLQVQIHEGSNLITVKYVDNEAEANGQTATIGFQGPGGASSNAHSVTCNGKVLDDNTTNSEGFSIAPSFNCGDAEPDPGEACDLGTANGASTSCCTSACALRASGSTCRPAAGVCDVADTCNGTSPTCTADAKSSAVCRAAADVCDVAESCDGVANDCPADVVASTAVVCRAAGGVCDVAEHCDGVGTACPADAKSSAVCRSAAGVCDVAESCDGVGNDCPADGFAATSVVCRGPAGACDVAETCTGVGAGCPADVLAASTVECRAVAGDCDVAESCTGGSPTCPADAFAASTVECRAAAGDCDVAEHCSGGGPTCPADAFAATTQECRAAAGACDVAEVCPGTGPACPADALAPSTQECRNANGACDVAESCTGSSPDCPADGVAASTVECRATAGDCDVAESCTGTSTDCPADAFASSTQECRAAAGDCDVAESCTGSDAGCPVDAFAPSTQECRAAAGVCDLAESCTGTDADCSADAFAPSTLECRAAAGACDVAESCTGTGADCPADGVSETSVVCRAPAGACDVAESCDGVSTGCPADVVASSATTCRASAGACDVTETCDGLATDCPVDGVAPSTQECRAAAGICDVAESCPGTGPDCPADVLAPSTQECRAAAGVCDLAESCTGTDPACPADGKSTAECRAAAGFCDLAESCDGSTDDCPSDALQPSSTECRAAAGVCDVAESCDGSTATCPADAIQPDDTPCSDGLACTTGDTCQAGVCVGQGDADGCADDFLCYKAKATTPFTRTTVTLADDFETGSFEVRKPKALCTPADKNGEGVLDQVTHLGSYQIRAPAGSPAHVRQTGIVVTNQLGQVSVDTVRPDLLLVPTAKSLTGPTSPPDPQTHDVDHYKCYKVKVTRGTTPFPRGVQVTVSDQFTAVKTFDLKKPRHLCTPADKNGEGIKNPSVRLLCYLGRPARGEPRHTKQSGVNLANQLGALVVSTVKESELCIPSM